MDGLLHQQVLNEIKGSKFDNTIDIMTQVSKSNTRQIGHTYRYLFEDEQERCEMMDEVRKNYKQGKYDPISYRFLPRQKRKKVIWLS